jgi:hypothetical protein
VASLEQRIEGLSSLLGSEAGPSSSSSVSEPVLPDPRPRPEHIQPPRQTHPPLSIRTPDSVATSVSGGGGQPGQRPRRQPEPSRAGPSSAQPQLQPQPPVDPAISPPYNFTWAQAESILADFKIKYLPNFPFVAFENPDISAYQLFQQRPFMFRAVLLVASPASVERKQKIQKLVMGYLAEHLLVEEERSLDLLQGLLVCIAWYVLSPGHGRSFIWNWGDTDDCLSGATSARFTITR